MRHEVATSYPWSAKDELVRAAANLEPSVRDRLKTKWKLELANQNQRPKSVAAPPPRRKRRASLGLKDVVCSDPEEDLSSSSDEEVLSARRRQQITGKVEPANRPLPNNVIELSSDDDVEGRPIDSIERDEVADDEIRSERETNSSAAGASNPAALEDDADEEAHRRQIEDIGGRFANRSISPGDWKSLCRMFQCREDIEDHKPVGFKLTLSGYQLHAIWWLLTQFPLRGVPGGCLGDEMGLGKTVEVLSVFVLFALIKRSYVEVRDYWSSGKTIGNRGHLPKDQMNLADAVCPSQHLMPSGLLCPCV